MNKNRILDGLDLFVTQNVHLKTKWAWFDLSKPLNLRPRHREITKENGWPSGSLVLQCVPQN